MKKLNSYSCVKLLFGLLLILCWSCEKDEVESKKVTDADGNIYTTVTIGDQVWMVEDLRTTKYRNGDPIEQVENNQDWGELNSGAFCTNLNGDDSHILYNWYAVNDSRNIAPKGWHVATYDDWETLVDYYDGIFVAGQKLKSYNNGHWATSDFPGDNESGFSANANGSRNINGAKLGQMFYGYWWTSTSYNAAEAYVRYMSCIDYKVTRAHGDKRYGFSVRCVKD